MINKIPQLANFQSKSEESSSPAPELDSIAAGCHSSLRRFLLCFLKPPQDSTPIPKLLRISCKSYHLVCTVRSQPPGMQNPPQLAIHHQNSLKASSKKGSFWFVLFLWSEKLEAVTSCQGTSQACQKVEVKLPGCNRYKLEPHKCYG